MTKAELKLLSGAVPTSKWTGVCFSSKGGGRWTAWGTGKRYLGIYDSQLLAAEAVGKDKGFATLKEWKAREESVKAPRLQEAILMFKVLYPIFGHMLPGDIEDAEVNFEIRLPAFTEDPLLEVISIQGKTGPWRTELFKAIATAPSLDAFGVMCRARRPATLRFETWGRLDVREVELLAERALRTLGLLIQCAEAMHGRKFKAGGLEGSEGKRGSNYIRNLRF